MSGESKQKGNDVLYRYLSRDQFKKATGYYHPDPMIDEFTYGEGGGFAAFVWNNLDKGSRLFFHTTIGGTRYLTAAYVVADLVPAAVWRADEMMRSRYKNPHLHPELFPEWWGDDAEGKALDEETRAAFAEGMIFKDRDIILKGDADESLDLRKSPIVLDKGVMARLHMQGKPIKWDIVDKSGRHYDDTRCISTCLRTPRLLSDVDGDFLMKMAQDAVGAIRVDKSYSCIRALDPFLASSIDLECSTEDEIEKYMIGRLEIVEPGLQYLGNQVRLNGGNRIDILARRKDGTPVIIEIKKGTADDGTLAQLMSYVHQYHNEHGGLLPVSKIICADASHRLTTACQHLKVDIHCYGEILERNEFGDVS